MYNGAKHYFRRNVQGDVTRIYAIDGSLTACYTYDAWGSCKVYDAYGNETTDIGFIGNVNPYRYRGYYYDVETGLYYCESRYYDPEVGRWINADDISYIDPETINGLNLYSYCGNNPVMNVDPNGNSWDSFWNKAGKWFKKNWQWVSGAVIIVGLGIAVIATGGAAAGVAGFIVAGAFKGAVIGAASGALIGGTISGISSVVGGGNFWSGALEGVKTGFFSGALIGAITGTISNSIQVGQAAKMWQAGTSIRTSTPFKTMVYHYKIYGQGGTGGTGGKGMDAALFRYAGNGGTGGTGGEGGSKGVGYKAIQPMATVNASFQTLTDGGNGQVGAGGRGGDGGRGGQRLNGSYAECGAKGALGTPGT